MSEMNDNLDSVKELLKLKRHEIPPPGYFNSFSGNVVARIRAGESGGGDSFLERLQAKSDFWSNVLHLFSAKPGLIGGLATSVCLVLLFGVVLMDNSESGTATPDAMAMQTPSAPTEATPTLASAVTLAAPDSSIAVSTNPISSFQPVSSMFGSPQTPLFQPVGFIPSSQ